MIKCLTARGRARLQEAKAFVRGTVADSLILVEHCGGIGAARRALETLGYDREGTCLPKSWSQPFESKSKATLAWCAAAI